MLGVVGDGKTTVDDVLGMWSLAAQLCMQTATRGVIDSPLFAMGVPAMLDQFRAALAMAKKLGFQSDVARWNSEAGSVKSALGAT